VFCHPTLPVNTTLVGPGESSISRRMPGSHGFGRLSGATLGQPRAAGGAGAELWRTRSPRTRMRPASPTRNTANHSDLITLAEYMMLIEESRTMPIYRAVILVFAVAVAATFATVLASDASTLCGNGAFCSSSETCVSHVRNAGHKYACSPFSNAVVCGDSRFSCPENHVCNFANYSCDSSKGNVALMINKNSNTLTGAVQNEGICDYIAEYVPSFCQCAQDQTGTQAQVTCSVKNFTFIFVMNSKNTIHH
jgi:hypothetical protein